MDDLEKQFRTDTEALELQYQSFKELLYLQNPDLAHVLFDAPICAEHEVPVDQCNCP